MASANGLATVIRSTEPGPHETDRQQLDAERQRDQEPERGLRERIELAARQDREPDRRGGAGGAHDGQAAEGTGKGAALGHLAKWVRPAAAERRGLLSLTGCPHSGRR
jgi:hypothetical protein